MRSRLALILYLSLLAWNFFASDQKVESSWQILSQLPPFTITNKNYSGTRFKTCNDGSHTGDFLEGFKGGCRWFPFQFWAQDLQSHRRCLPWPPSRGKSVEWTWHPWNLSTSCSFRGIGTQWVKLVKETSSRQLWLTSSNILGHRVGPVKASNYTQRTSYWSLLSVLSLR